MDSTVNMKEEVDKHTCTIPTRTLERTVKVPCV